MHWWSRFLFCHKNWHPDRKLRNGTRHSKSENQLGTVATGLKTPLNDQPGTGRNFRLPWWTNQGQKECRPWQAPFPFPDIVHPKPWFDFPKPARLGLSHSLYLGQVRSSKHANRFPCSPIVPSCFTSFSWSSWLITKIPGSGPVLRWDD